MSNLPVSLLRSIPTLTDIVQPGFSAMPATAVHERDKARDFVPSPQKTSLDFSETVAIPLIAHQVETKVTTPHSVHSVDTLKVNDVNDVNDVDDEVTKDEIAKVAQHVLRRIEPVLVQHLREVVDQIIQEHTHTLIPRLRQEIEWAVREAVLQEQTASNSTNSNQTSSQTSSNS